MIFSEKYTDKDKEMVLKIKANLADRKISATKAGTEFSGKIPQMILVGTADFEIQPKLNNMWADIFGEGVKVGDVSSGNAYTVDDNLLVAQIKVRMAGPEAKAKGLTGKSIAASLGMSTAMFSQVVNSKYTSSPTEHLKLIWASVEPLTAAALVKTSKATSENGPIALRYGDIPYVNTQLISVLKITCDHAIARRRFTVFTGQPGLGKTTSLEHYCEQNKKAILLLGCEDTGAVEIVEQLCEHLDITFTNVKQSRPKIIKALKNTDSLIILDEADKCKSGAFNPLRKISDVAKVGVTLVGNLELTDMLKTRPAMALINSRVCYWTEPAGKIPVADIEKLFTELTKGTLPLSVDSPEWWEWLWKRVEGNARTLVESLLPNLLDYQTKMRAKDNVEIKVNKTLVNGIFSTILNEPAM